VIRDLGTIVAASLVACVVALSSAGARAESAPVKVAATLKPITLGATQPGQVIVAKRFFVKPNDAKVGALQTGWFCSNVAELRFTDKFGASMLRTANLAVRRELDAAGYPKVVESAFDSALPNTSVEYELAATLTDVQMTVCGIDDDVKGGVWMQLDWELFSPRERKVVYRATVEGSAQTAEGKRMQPNDLVQQALTANVRNLLANPAFVDQATRRASGGAIDVSAALAVASRPRAGSRAQDRMPALQSAMVTIFSGGGSGSGFFISSDGHLLTNQHVVGDAKFVKIKLATGRELLGEVLRSDSGRDVALVKTEPVALSAMDLAPAEPRSGDEVFALGSPLGEALAGTVTRGVLSSVREIEQRRWLQSDVRVLPGSSGGPLLGADGGVVGITARGLGEGQLGVNLFVPIREAMSALRLEFRVE
jgi:S1-C subfamily serine protease